MQGKIDKNGHLFIRRKNTIKEQLCPFYSAKSLTGQNCGDWCPLFEEPERGYKINADLLDENKKPFKINICQTTLYFDELTDERE